MFEAFQEKDYRAFWTTQFISNIGSWMQTVAQGWLVYRLTDSPFLLGFVGFASSIPSFFLMLPGGVVADHFDRRRVVSASQWAQALSALFLAVSIRTNQIDVWQIIAASFVFAIAISFSAPAWQAMVVDLLDDRERLPNAIAMNSLQFNLSRALGPVIAGITLAAWGSFWCFLFNAISFLPLIFVLGRITKRQKPPQPTAKLWALMAEGFAFVRGDRVILLALSIVAAASLFGYPYVTIMPMVARILYAHDDARGLGMLMGGIGAGALAGSAALSISTPAPRRMMPLIFTCMIVFGVALGGVAFVREHAAVGRDAALRLRQPLQDLFGRGAPAGVHRRVAEGVLRRLRLAQVLHQVEELRGRLRLEGHHEVLIVQAERVRGVDLHARVLVPDGDVLVHDALPLRHRQQVPVARPHEGEDEQVRTPSGDDA